MNGQAFFETIKINMQEICFQPELFAYVLFKRFTIYNQLFLFVSNLVCIWLHAFT